MPPSKTVDASCYIGTDSALVEMTDMFGLASNGAVTVTNEARVGMRNEEASIHAVQTTIEIGSLYDGDNTEALRAMVGDAASVAVIDDVGWECFPVDVMPLPQTGPSNAPVTSQITLPQSGRGRYAVGAAIAFNLVATSASLTVDTSGATGAHIIVTSVSSTAPANFRIGNSGNNNFATIPASVGIHAVDIPSGGRGSSATISITDASNRSAAGYVLIGSDQPIASG